ncbi:MAG: PTS sugar transporter subunit IIB [Propionicimonas sp.]
MRILVVCGAGASSTFVAQRINSAARARKLAYIATATNQASLEDVEASDLILVGPHLAPHLDQIISVAAGVPVVLLDADVYADLDGTRTLARIEAAVGDGST